MGRVALYSVIAALVLGVVAGAVWLTRSPPTAPQPTARQEPRPAPLPPPPVPAPVTALNPSFDVVRVAPDGRVVMAGRAAPGASVTVRNGDQVLGETTADSRGEWVLLPSQPLPPGPRELALSARNPGGEERQAEATVVMVVPSPAEPAPLAVLLPRDGDGATRVLQVPPAQGDMSAVKGLALDAIDYDQKGLARPSGKAAPGAELRIYLDNRAVAETRADAGGQWSAAPAEPVPHGQHVLRVDQIGPDGRVSGRIEVPFSRAGAPLGPTPGQFVVQPGNSLWRIARRTYGSGERFAVIYLANREQIRDPNKIYPGQSLTVPAQR